MKATIETYGVGEDGTVTLAVQVPTPVADLPDGIGGVATDAGDNASTITWTWSPEMRPVDPRAAVREHLDGVMLAASPCALAEPGEEL